ncbi:MAG TPA: HAD family hydrolase [Bacillales bacterium]|nr:HAD family hydrolase [Bacillales bacterium]
MIRAVIFDFDGLILDTESQEWKSLQLLYKEYGAELTLDVWGPVVGTQAGFDAVDHLQELTGKAVDRELFRKRHRQQVLSAIEKENPLPGVQENLAVAKRLGLKIGLATSSSYDWVSSHLKRLGLFDDFECITTADDVEEVKPNPDVYLKTAACLGVAPQEALAFEDSANGSLAAKRAGMYCVVIPNPVTQTMTFCDEIDHRMKTMADMELSELIAYLEADRS